MAKKYPATHAFFSDSDGVLSFKRLQTALFTLLFTAAFITDLATDVTISDNLLDALTVLLMYGYTGIVVEKFKRSEPATPAKKKADEEEEGD